MLRSLERRNDLSGHGNGERLLEISQFAWWIGQIFLATLYIGSPLYCCLVSSRFVTIFRFLTSCIRIYISGSWPKITGNYLDTKAYSTGDASTKVFDGMQQTGQTLLGLRSPLPQLGRPTLKEVQFHLSSWLLASFVCNFSF